MTPGVVNFSTVAGDTFVTTCEFRTGSTTGSLFDFTGATAEFKVYEIGDAGATLLTLTQADGLTLGGAAGTIVIAISSTRTAQIGSGRYRIALAVTTSGGVKTTYLAGDLSVTQRVLT